MSEKLWPWRWAHSATTSAISRPSWAGVTSPASPWTETSITIGGRTISDYYITAYPQVSILAMLLPDGNVNGLGWTSTGFTSLYKLATGAISSLSSLDTVHPNSYTQAQLLNFITAVYVAVAPYRINIQDNTLPTNSNGQFVGTLSDATGQPNQIATTDHSDHMYGAQDAFSAVTQSPWYGSHNFFMQAYEDYPNEANQQGFYNIGPASYGAYDGLKWYLWDVYVPYDSVIYPSCSSESVCETSNLPYYLRTQGEWTRAEWNYGLGF